MREIHREIAAGEHRIQVVAQLFESHRALASGRAAVHLHEVADVRLRRFGQPLQLIVAEPQRRPFGTELLAALGRLGEVLHLAAQLGVFAPQPLALSQRAAVCPCGDKGDNTASAQGARKQSQSVQSVGEGVCPGGNEAAAQAYYYRYHAHRGQEHPGREGATAGFQACIPPCISSLSCPPSAASCAGAARGGRRCGCRPCTRRPRCARISSRGTARCSCSV